VVEAVNGDEIARSSRPEGFLHGAGIAAANRASASSFRSRFIASAFRSRVNTGIEPPQIPNDPAPSSRGDVSGGVSWPLALKRSGRFRAVALKNTRAQDTPNMGCRG
jgi:hypothetical protein